MPNASSGGQGMEKPSGLSCARKVGAGLGGQEVREVGEAEQVLLTTCGTPSACCIQNKGISSGHPCHVVKQYEPKGLLSGEKGKSVLGKEEA